MKKKLSLTALTLLGAATMLVSCGETPTSSVEPTTVDPTTVEPTTVEPTTSEPTPVTELNVAWATEVTDWWFVGDTNKVVVTVNEGAEPELEFESSNPAVATVDDEGNVEIVGKGKATITVTELDSMLSKQLSLTATVHADLATGGQAYELSYDGRAEVLSILEGYAIDKGITGTSIFENGGYVMYNPRVVKGTNNYITGYGFGVLSDGSLSSELEAETNPDWKMYYHTYNSEDPQTINAMNADGSLVSDLYSYIEAGFYGTKMNETKDGYVWFPQLAKGKPVAIDSNGNEVANPGQTKFTTWKIKLNTGADGLKYNTLSAMPEIAAFNGRDVALDDYINSYRILLTKKYGYFRSAENAASTNSSFIVGADNYYAATETETTDLETFLGMVKIVPNYEENSLTFTLGNACSQFYAQYYISGYNPCPQDFFDMFEENPDSFHGFVETGALAGATPVDTALSVGPYTIESWSSKATEIVFKKNPYYVERLYPELSNRYTIDGVHIKLLPGLKQDTDLAMKEFLEGKLDSASITKNYLEQYAGDERTSIVKGSSVFKLNFNALDQETWIKLFGVNGTVNPHPSEESYYQCKPIMSNSHFIKGLGLSIDRLTYAAKTGNTPSQEYFSGAYLINPEEGIAYNDTKWHKDVLKDYYPETFGFNLAAARAEFREAVAELVEEGYYDLGTKKNPTKVSVMITWMNSTDPDNYGNDIVQYFEDAFNHESVCDGKLQLVVEQEVAGATYDVVYDRMKSGEFDIGFGSISGMANDPLGFMEVLKSDNSTGFTLNWGVDTSVADKGIVYDGKYWSFDGLWTAATKGCILDNEGFVQETFDDIDFAKFAIVDGNLEVELLIYAIYAAGVELEFDGVSIYVSGIGETGYFLLQDSVEVFEEEGYQVFHMIGTVPAAYLKALNLVDAEGVARHQAFYFCCYYYLSINGITNFSEVDYSLYFDTLINYGATLGE